MFIKLTLRTDMYLLNDPKYKKVNKRKNFSCVIRMKTSQGDSTHKRCDLVDIKSRT